jgi:hypothetical protein
MQQRQPRLGDILDDYCTRERRITNHAVVAMVGSDIKQTRCTTCEAEHEYKQARLPVSRRKAGVGNLVAKDPAPNTKRASRQAVPPPAVPTDSPDTSAQAEASAVEPAAAKPAEVPASAETRVEKPSPVAAAATADNGRLNDEVGEDAAEESNGNLAEEEGPVHRRLIRATLPRPDGQLPARPSPDFTVRQPGFKGKRNNGGSGSMRGGSAQGGRQASTRGGVRQFSARPGRPSGNNRFQDQRQRQSRAGQPMHRGKKGSK